MDLVTIHTRLADELDRLSFGPPVGHVYNPLRYAWAPFAHYLTSFGQGPREVVLLGMNPGPFGMAQTGVPFGDPRWARDFLGIRGEITRPEREHPRRPVLGWESPRGEVSGDRIWTFVEGRFGTPGAFFARFFILNWCPLAFLGGSGANITPDKLARGEREALGAACDRALAASLGVLRPRVVVGIGGFAEMCLRRVAPPGVQIGRMLHPSPASPKANQGWEEIAVAELRAMGVEVPDRRPQKA